MHKSRVTSQMGLQNATTTVCAAVSAENFGGQGASAAQFVVDGIGGANGWNNSGNRCFATGEAGFNTRRRSGGFSLIEVTLALGIVGFAFVVLIGLLPAGLSVF